jgi:HPt (histidine-containing phosphotransfer) domain-containing protein
VIAPEKTFNVQTEKILVPAPRGVPAGMLTTYVNRCLAALPAAVTALNQLDYGHMRVLGHRLRGSGGAYGIPGLTEFGLHLEEAALRSDGTELRRELVELEAYLRRVEILPD